MDFISPVFLGFLIIIPLMVSGYFAILKRKRAIIRFSSLDTIKQAQTTGSKIKRYLPPVLFLLGTAVILFSLARPQATITLPFQRQTVILAIDISSSMVDTDIKPTRFAAAKIAIKKFIQEQPSNTNVGIVAFGSNAMLIQYPTLDKDALNKALDTLKPDGATAIGDAIIESLRTIFPEEKIDLYKTPEKPEVKPGSYTSAAIVLITDGENTMGAIPTDAAKRAAYYGVRVFSIGFGTIGSNDPIDPNDPNSPPSAEPFNEKALKEISEITHGEYDHATNQLDLEKIYHETSTRLVLERSKTELTAFFALAAATLLIIAGVLSLIWSHW